MAVANLEQVEEQRLSLEENTAKLRKALQHWRQWDAEYEGLKEELLALDSGASHDDMIITGKDLDGELVNEREVRELVGLDKGQARGRDQVVHLVMRRQDYVQQNIRTIEKQLDSIQAQLERLDDFGDTQSAPSLPLTEIVEELDEDGNVVSSKVTQPENATANIIETLRKAGVTELEGKESSASKLETPAVAGTAEEKGPQPSAREQILTVSESSTRDIHKAGATKGIPERPRPRKKSVSFTEDTKPASDVPDAQKHSVKKPSDPIGNIKERNNMTTSPSAAEQSFLPDKAPEAQRRQPAASLIKGSFNSNDRVIEIDDDDEIIGSTPVIPEDESPEDARLRREMLQYSLNEVGSVVAELELDENWSDDDEDDDLDLDDGGVPYTSDEEEEDEFGRSLGKGISDDYRKQMLELQEKLGTGVIGNLGPDPEAVLDSAQMNPEELRRLVIRDTTTSDVKDQPSKETGQPAKKADQPRKGVRFADTLDVAPNKPAPQTQLAQPKESKPRAAEPSPLSDVVFERKAAADPPASAPSAEKKASRFKQSRQANAAPPKSQEDPLLSDTVIERPSTDTTRPPEVPDEFDPELQERQLASEYYRLRNNMIRQQGGFRATEEDEDAPLMEEAEDGRVKKVSRFKAARLKS